jgi:hypothetical protein
VHQFFIVTSLLLLLPVIQTNFFRCRDFQSAEEKNPQKFLILKIIYQCYIKHIMTTLRKTIMSVLKSRHILSLADNVCLDLQKCPYSIFIYRITSIFCGFGLKRRHLIFADFFKIYILNIKHFTDIDPTVDFVFPVNKIDREKGEKTIRS